MAQRTESLVDYLARSMNPLTSSEAERFKALAGQARRGQFFTYEEAVEYDKLIRKIQAERPDDSSIWPLVALGAFLMGLYLGRRPDDKQ